jgi:hypothetical protein
VVLGELTPLQETFNEPPAATVEALALRVASPVVGVGVATGVGVGVGVAFVVLSTVTGSEVAIVVNPLFLLSRNSYTPGVVGKLIDTVPTLKAVEPKLWLPLLVYTYDK